jgi:hypothetical protein
MLNSTTGEKCPKRSFLILHTSLWLGFFTHPCRKNHCRVNIKRVQIEVIVQIKTVLLFLGELN